MAIPPPFLLLQRTKYPSFLPINNSVCAHIPLLWAPALSIISCTPYVLALFLSPWERALLSPFSSLPLTLPPTTALSCLTPSLLLGKSLVIHLFSTSQSIKTVLLITSYLGACEARFEIQNCRWQITSLDCMEGKVKLCAQVAGPGDG